MRKMIQTIIIVLIYGFMSLSVYAGTGKEFGGLCAASLAKGEKQQTDCSITWTDEYIDKTFCFSSEEAKNIYIQKPKSNLSRAMENYLKYREDEGSL